MGIENHQYRATIRALTETDLEELLDILGLPLDLWEKDVRKSGELYNLRYGFGDSKESVRIHLGNHANGFMHSVIRDTWTDYKWRETHILPAGYEPYYGRAWLLLQGSYFDNVSNFNFERLLTFLDRVGHTPKGLDIAFCDDQKVTTIEDWIPVLESWRNHCIGNMIKKQPITVVRDSGNFVRAQIGVASSPTMYGTFYVRPDGQKRLEIKMRDSEQIREQLAHYSETDRTAYNEAALEMLVKNLDIFTAESVKTAKEKKNIGLREREPFWTAFLASRPTKTKKKAKKDTATKELQKSYSEGIKNLSGRIYNFYRKHAGLKSGAAVADELSTVLEQLRGSPDYSLS